MPHVVERATTGRAKCRACGATIAKDQVRVGEAVPNMFADADGAEAMHWYHPRCAAYRRPDAFMAAVETSDLAFDEREALVAAAALGIEHPRLARLDQAGRAPSARAACRHCREPIPKDAWRLSLLFWQDGRFMPSGFIHAACAREYLGTADLLDRLRHAMPALSEADAAAIAAALTPPPAAG